MDKEQECPHIQRKQAGDETYDICELNSKPCLIEHGLYECETWNGIKREVNLMALTREESIRITIELWTWVVKTGEDKWEWPGWQKYGRMENNCPFCEYGQQQVNLGVEDETCDACPYFQKFGGCCAGDSPYERWCRAKTKKTSKKYATLFLEQLKQL